MISNQLSIINMQVSGPRLIKKRYFCLVSMREPPEKLMWNYGHGLVIFQTSNCTIGLNLGQVWELSVAQLSHFIDFFQLCGLIFQHELQPELIQWPCECQGRGGNNLRLYYSVPGTRVSKPLRSLRQYLNVYWIHNKNKVTLSQITIHILYLHLTYSLKPYSIFCCIPSTFASS